MFTVQKDGRTRTLFNDIQRDAFLNAGWELAEGTKAGAKPDGAPEPKPAGEPDNAPDPKVTEAQGAEGNQREGDIGALREKAAALGIKLGPNPNISAAKILARIAEAEEKSVSA
jgi:hypothetical protein